MHKTKLFINAIFILMLVLTALGNTSLLGQAGTDKDASRVDAYLLGLVLERPDDIFRVIVRKDAKESNLEKDVVEGGGKVNKRLELIAGFSAEMSGRDVLKLARHNDVRWISADAQVILAGGFDSNTYRDEFITIGYGGSTGTQAWGTKPWVELGETDGASRGKVMVVASRLRHGHPRPRQAGGRRLQRVLPRLRARPVARAAG